MKRLFAIVFLCGFLIPCAYGETITYSNAKYVGDVVNGVPHGEGTMTWSDGSKFIGHFKSGMFHGEGIMIYHDSAETVGEWKFGVPWNAVSYGPPPLQKFVGSFEDGVPRGKGQ